MPPNIYLAGPTVFMPDAASKGQALKAACERRSCNGLFPLDAPLPELSAEAIFLACMDMLSRAQAVVADLSPFRGPNVDDGTAFELGVAAAKGIPIFGYSSDLRTLEERIPHDAGKLVDENGIEIENFGRPFNAMIAGALTLPVFGSSDAAIEAAAAHMRGV